MALRAYLRIVFRKWWIFLPVFLTTLIASVVLAVNEEPVYQARATYLVRLASVFQDNKEFVSALDILSRRSEIATTFAEVAGSRTIKQRAIEQLALTSEEVSGLSVDTRLVAETSLLEIAARGRDPALVRDFANAVGTQMVAYVKTLYEAFELEPLDQAVLPRSPSEPNRMLIVGLGLAFGLALGVGMAFLAEYVQAPSEEAEAFKIAFNVFNIIDGEIGTYNRRFLLLRLRQEMSRAKRNDYPLSMALINVDRRGALARVSPQDRREALRQIAMRFQLQLRDEDVMARAGDTIFAFLLPDLQGETAEALVEQMRTEVAVAPLAVEASDTRFDAQGVASVVEYRGDSADPEELLRQAMRALEQAEMTTHGKVYLISGMGDSVDHG